MNSAGITKRVVDFAQSLVGHIKGGLAHVNILSSMFFAGISGSATADTSALGSMLIPIMRRDGYSAEFSVAVTAASSTIGPIIPPSILMVMYGVIANESIAKLFVAGLIPGVLVGLTQMVMAYRIAIKEGYGSVGRFSVRNVIKTFKRSILAIIMPLIILGGILSGIFTATEAGVIACVYAMIVGIFVYKKITFKDLPELFSSQLKSLHKHSSSLLQHLCSVGYWHGLDFPVKFETFIDYQYKSLGCIVLGHWVYSVAWIVCRRNPCTDNICSDLCSCHAGARCFVSPVWCTIYYGSTGRFYHTAGRCVIISWMWNSRIPVSQASKIIWPFVLTIIIVIVAGIIFPDIITFIPRLIYG